MAHKGNVAALLKPDTINTRTARGSFGSVAQALSGLLKIMPNPSTLLNKIGRDITVYDELLSDGKVSAAIQAFNAGVTSREFTVIPGDCPVDIFTEIQAVIESLPIMQLIEEILTAKQYGYAVHEIEWKGGPAGRIDPVAATLKPAKWFGFDDTGKLLFRSIHNHGGEPIEHPMKVIISRNQPTATNPYGKSNLEQCYWPVQIKKTNLEFWLLFAERYGMPWPTITYNPVFFEEDGKVQELANTVLEMYQDGILVLPESVSADVKSTGSSSNSAIYREAIEYVDSIITQIWLGHDGAMNGTPGALGDQETAVQVREDIVVSGARLVEQFFFTLINYINVMNYGLEPERLPWIELRKKEKFDINILNRDTGLAKDHGIIFNKEYYAKTYGLEIDSFKIPSISSNQVRFTVGGLTTLYQYQVAYASGMLPRNICINAAMTAFGYDYPDALGLFPADSFGVSAPVAPGPGFNRTLPEGDVPKQLDNKRFAVELGEGLTQPQAATETVLGVALDEREVSATVAPMVDAIKERLSGMSAKEIEEFLLTPEAFDMIDTGKLESDVIQSQFLAAIAGAVAEVE